MSDCITIQDGKVTLATEEGQTLERPESDLRKMIQQEVLPPLNGAAFPDGIKFFKWQPPAFVLVHQMPPHVRQLRWITDNSPADFGPGTKYETVRLSMPYAITFAVYYQYGEQLVLSGSNELYFRNEPLRTLNDSLGYAALLNISRIQTGNRTVSWICTQHLRPSRKTDWCQQLEALLEHTWNGAFNRSSERHEGQSMYGYSKDVHPDLHPIQRWCQATEANETFALGVKWKPVPQNVGQLMDCMLQEHRGASGFLSPRLHKKPAASLVAQFMNFAQQTPSKGKG
jgi:hypothetical protein